MSKSFELNAVVRNDLGKGASRRLRRLTDQVPAIIYGGEKAPATIALTQKEVLKSIENEAFFSHILTINLDGKQEKVLIKDMQRHAYKLRITHMDFQRVSAKDILTRNVPLHFLNGDSAPGIKAGGVISHNMKEIEITCAASDLPENIEIDLANLELEGIIHLSDLKLAKGITIKALTLGDDHNFPVVSIHIPRVVEEEDVEAATDEAASEETPAAEDEEKKEEDK